MAMSSYQAIPDASAAADLAMENGESELPSLTRNNSSSLSSQQYVLASSASALMSKFGYIALGLVLGYCSSESGRRSLWNPTVKFNSTEPEETESPWFFKHHNHEDYDEEGLSIHNIDKSFSHSLPFEDAFPGMKVWADSLPSVLSEESKILSETSSPFTSFFMGAATTATSSSAGAGSASSSSNNNKHLLYLVHSTAVTLLYDSSKSSPNTLISEYSLDYFLINSGGFDAQINQAYCGVVRNRYVDFAAILTAFHE